MALVYNPDTNQYEENESPLAVNLRGAGATGGPSQMWNQTVTMRDPNNPDGPPITKPYSFDVSQGPNALALDMYKTMGSGSINYSPTGTPYWSSQAPNTGESGLANVEQYDPATGKWVTQNSFGEGYNSEGGLTQNMGYDPSKYTQQGFTGSMPWEMNNKSEKGLGYQANRFMQGAVGPALPYVLAAGNAYGLGLGAAAALGAGATGIGGAAAGGMTAAGEGGLMAGTTLGGAAFPELGMGATAALGTSGGGMSAVGAGLGAGAVGGGSTLAGELSGIGAEEAAASAGMETAPSWVEPEMAGNIDMPFGEDYAGAAKTQTNPFSDAYDTYKKGKGIYDQFKGLLGGDTSSQQQMRQQGSSLPGTDWMKLGDQGKLERFMKEGGDFSQLQAFTDKLNKKPEYPGF
jgi:hypothetical protein